ncbi:MAG: hypothetical protein NVS1B13_24700 [Flavisolibacter sp.]
MNYVEQIMELLDFGRPIFDEIDGLVGAEKFNDAYQMIEVMNPPPEWIKVSKTIEGDQYRYIPIGLLESVMFRVFRKVRTDDLLFGYPIQAAGKGCAVTITHKIGYLGFEGEWKQTVGIATEYCKDWPGLSAATPKASSAAYKNGAKKIGALFGKYLNRELEDDQEDVPIVNIAEDRELIDAINEVNKATNMREITVLMRKHSKYQATKEFLDEIGRKSKEFK